MDGKSWIPVWGCKERGFSARMRAKLWLSKTSAGERARRLFTCKRSPGGCLRGRLRRAPSTRSHRYVQSCLPSSVNQLLSCCLPAKIIYYALQLAEKAPLSIPGLHNVVSVALVAAAYMHTSSCNTCMRLQSDQLHK